jgi:hypothetical protein
MSIKEKLKTFLSERPYLANKPINDVINIIIDEKEVQPQTDAEEKELTNYLSVLRQQYGPVNSEYGPPRLLEFITKELYSSGGTHRKSHRRRRSIRRRSIRRRRRSTRTRR